MKKVAEKLPQSERNRTLTHKEYQMKYGKVLPLGEMEEPG